MFEQHTAPIDQDGLFGLVPAKPLFHDPHAEARRQRDAQREAEEKADLERRVNALPSREQMAVMAMDLAEAHIHPDTKIKAMQFAAQLLGYTEKVPAKNRDAITAGAKVMAVPVAATDADWEKHATQYMKRLEKLANG